MIAWIAAPALVHRRGRHDRQLVGRLQRAAGRGAPPAGAQGDHHRRARPTTATPTTSTTWAAACSTTTLNWAVDDVRPQLAPARPALVGERWREMWLRAPRRPPAVDRRLAAPPAPRRLLEARLGDARTTPHRVPRSTPSAAGPTATRNAVPRLLAGLDVPRKGLIGPVGASVPAHGRARTRHRLPPGGDALVGSLAQGRATPASWTSRCCAPGCRSAVPPAARMIDARALGRRARAGRARASSRAASTSTRAARRRGGRDGALAIARPRRSASPPAVVRHGLGARPADRPARRRRRSRWLRHRAAREPHRDARRARRSSSSSPSIARVALVASGSTRCGPTAR